MYVYICTYVCMHVLKAREREREIALLVVLEFQLTLAKVGRPDKNLLRAGCGTQAGGCRPLLYKTSDNPVIVIMTVLSL